MQFPAIHFDRGVLRSQQRYAEWQSLCRATGVQQCPPCLYNLAVTRPWRLMRVGWERCSHLTLARAIRTSSACNAFVISVDGYSFDLALSGWPAPAAFLRRLASRKQLLFKNRHIRHRYHIACLKGRAECSHPLLTNSPVPRAPVSPD